MAGRGNSAKKVKTRAVPGASTQKPKSAAGLVVGEDISLEDSTPCWDFRLMDHSHSGAWDWDLTPEEHDQFLAFLRDMQRSTWREIGQMTYNGAGGYRKNSNHAMKAEVICEEAKSRLDKLGIGDQESLYRFRLGSSLRIWGAFIAARHEFSVLWWDRDHKVYPLDS